MVEGLSDWWMVDSVMVEGVDGSTTDAGGNDSITTTSDSGAVAFVLLFFCKYPDLQSRGWQLVPVVFFSLVGGSPGSLLPLFTPATWS